MLSVSRSLALLLSAAGLGFGQEIGPAPHVPPPAPAAEPNPVSPTEPQVPELDPAPRAEPVVAPPDGEVPGFMIVPSVDQLPNGKPKKATPGEGGTSRSRSRQFVVHAKDSEVRGAFCVFCEDVKAELLAMLGVRPPGTFKFPIHIHVRGHTMDLNDGPPVRSSVSLIEGGGYSLVTVVDLGNEFTREGLRKEITTLLLAERIVRGHPKVTFAGRKVLPDWLRVGISEAIDFRRRDRPPEMFSAIYKSGKMLSVNDIIYGNAGTSNWVSDKIYGASCAGFLMALGNQDDGPERLHRLIGDLAVFNGTPTALLAKHFPGTGGSQNSLEKWWALELATIAQPTVKDILDPVASEEALGKCLQARWLDHVPITAAPSIQGAPEANERRRVWQVLRPRRPKETRSTAATAATGDKRAEVRTADLTEYRKFADREDLEKVLKRLEVALIQLSYRAFPLHRPMIREYQIVIEQIRRGKTKGVDERLAALAAARVELLRAAKDATDYLHHYQATQVGHLSGAFEAYKAALEEVTKPLPPREDKLSKYLDDLDKEYR